MYSLFYGSFCFLIEIHLLRNLAKKSNSKLYKAYFWSHQECHSPCLFFLSIVYHILFFICLCVCSKYVNMYTYMVGAVHMHVCGCRFKPNVFLGCCLPYFLRGADHQTWSSPIQPGLLSSKLFGSAASSPQHWCSDICTMPTFHTYANTPPLSDLPSHEMNFPTFLWCCLPSLLERVEEKTLALYLLSWC